MPHSNATPLIDLSDYAQLGDRRPAVPLVRAHCSCCGETQDLERDSHEITFLARVKTTPCENCNQRALTLTEHVQTVAAFGVAS